VKTRNPASSRPTRFTALPEPGPSFLAPPFPACPPPSPLPRRSRPRCCRSPAASATWSRCCWSNALPPTASGCGAPRSSRISPWACVSPRSGFSAVSPSTRPAFGNRCSSRPCFSSARFLPSPPSPGTSRWPRRCWA